MKSEEEMIDSRIRIIEGRYTSISLPIIRGGKILTIFICPLILMIGVILHVIKEMLAVLNDAFMQYADSVKDAGELKKLRKAKK